VQAPPSDGGEYALTGNGGEMGWEGKESFANRVIGVDADEPTDDLGELGNYALTATSKLWKKVTTDPVYKLNITAVSPEQDLFNAFIGAWTAHNTPLADDFLDAQWTTYFDATAPYYTADFLDGLALARGNFGDWKFISIIEGLSVDGWTLFPGESCAYTFEIDALLPTDVTTWTHGDIGGEYALTIENGDILPARDVWRDVSRPGAFAPRFARGELLEIAPDIYFRTVFDYVNEW
jgi:hypothetical protein